MSLKKELVTLLDNLASILEFKGDNPFKINAFRNGANIIRSIEDDLESIIKSGEIKHVKGLGKGLLQIINEYYEKGFSSEYNAVTSEVPVGILDLLKINGLGAKKIKVLYTELGISNLEDLESACLDGRIASVKGFGEKTQESILKEIERININRNLILQSIAQKRSVEITDKLKKISPIRIEITGEIRRANEVISKLEFLALISDKSLFEKELKESFEVKDAFEVNKRIPSLPNYSSDTCGGFELNEYSDFPVIVYYTTSKSEFELLLFHTTGSEEFIKILTKEEDIKGETEDNRFIGSDIGFIIPEMREVNYFEAPSELRNNSRLSIKNFKGLLHFHTNYSDGQNTIMEMSKSAETLGFEFAVICDHSKAAFYANGLNEERVLKQKQEIQSIGKSFVIKLFHGIECDILKDGQLDYSEDFLMNFDFIVASVHSSFKLTEEEMTKRIITAIENPNTDLLGHPTGRLLLSRSAYKVNMQKVIDACASNNVALEINANPFRLDLDWRLIYYAREKGCLFSINPDAHSTEGIKDIAYGIRTARKGGLQPEEVINCYGINDFRKFLKRKISREV
jgi:DNA polymerase (family 10)